MTSENTIPPSELVGEDLGGGLYSAPASSLYIKPEWDGSPTISKFYSPNPKPGEEIHFVRLFEERGVGHEHFGSVLPLVNGRPFQCSTAGYVTFGASKYCFGCSVRTALFVAALLTLFLDGAEAAKRYYEPKVV